MQPTRIRQIIFIVLAAALVAFIFFNGRNNSSALVKENAGKGMEKQQASTFNFAEFEKSTLPKLNKADIDSLMLLKSKINDNRGKTDEYVQSIAEKYERLKQPILAAYYYEQLGEKQKYNKSAWLKAGSNYYDAIFTLANPNDSDQQIVAFFADKSISALSKVLSSDPGNNDAKVLLATAYINGKQETMKGVGLLKEVEQAQPDNRKALYNLGMLSLQSGQFDKAITRFEKLTSLDGSNDVNYPFYFRFLGEAYFKSGKKEQAIASLNKYKELVAQMNDDRLKKDADDMLKSLEHHAN
jgi:tetratricopeptide (TPR) repeat protein